MKSWAPPFPPVPPDALSIQRKKCSICKNKVRKAVIDAALDKDVSLAVIQRDMAESGWSIGYLPLRRHRDHYVSSAGLSKLRGKDLAIVIRDRTLEAIEDGRLDIADSDTWKNVAPGLKAQDILDKRERQTDMTKIMLAFARMIGGGESPPPEVAQIEDGLTIEGDYEELT